MVYKRLVHEPFCVGEVRWSVERGARCFLGKLQQFFFLRLAELFEHFKEGSLQEFCPGEFLNELLLDGRLFKLI